MEWVDAASGNPTNRFVEYKTGGHGTEMFKAHPELQGEIVAWYEATLLGRGKPASTDNAARRNAPTTRLLVMTDDPDGGAKLLQTLQAEKAKKSSSPSSSRPSSTCSVTCWSAKATRRAGSRC